MISLLLHESEVKQRMSVNKKDIIQIHLGYYRVITLEPYKSMLLL